MGFLLDPHLLPKGVLKNTHLLLMGFLENPYLLLKSLLSLVHLLLGRFVTLSCGFCLRTHDEIYTYRTYDDAYEKIQKFH